jgi:hypothetical protein
MNLKNAIPRIQMNLIHEYSQNANPYMTPVPPDIFPPTLYEDCSISTIIPLDMRLTLNTDYPATAPNLLANFIKILPQESVECSAQCTSHLFYIIQGSGLMTTRNGSYDWEEGDLFVCPGNDPVPFVSTPRWLGHLLVFLEKT